MSRLHLALGLVAVLSALAWVQTTAAKGPYEVVITGGDLSGTVVIPVDEVTQITGGEENPSPQGRTRVAQPDASAGQMYTLGLAVVDNTGAPGVVRQFRYFRSRTGDAAVSDVPAAWRRVILSATSPPSSTTSRGRSTLSTGGT